VDYTSLRKVKVTKPQARLTREQRKTNLRGSFGVADHEIIKGKSILLLDDVSTTQSTIGEAARTLKKAKVERVECLVLALTLPSILSKQVE
jgi:predicted amidophosphoribosyltransferase